MSRMRCSLLVIICLPFLTTSAWVQTDNLKQYLHDHYANKTFIIRDFLSGNHLSYDSSGSPSKKTSVGDWTETAFVTVSDDSRIKNNQLVLRARRMVVLFIENKFQLHTGAGGFVGIEIELGGNPSPESVNAALSKVFLNSHDSFVDLVPGYWRPCVSSGAGDGNCAFAPQLLTMLGVKTEGPQPKGNSIGSSQPKEISIASSRVKETYIAPSQVNETSIGSSQPGETSIGSSTNGGIGSIHGQVRHNISAPKATYTPEAQLSEAARALNIRGTVSIMLVVNKDGRPGNFRIVRPLGAGLDAKAVQAMQNSRFQPAKKDGAPVAVQIFVETEFHQ
jgi:TonB family protein